MSGKSVLIQVLVGLLILSFNPVNAEVTADPYGVMTSVENNDTLEVEVILSNDADVEIPFTVNFEKPPEGEGQQRGPRRDEVDLDGMMFAVFQVQQAYAWLAESMVGRVVDDGQLDDYRNANDWNEVEFEDYNVIVLAAGQRQNFTQQYNNNLERLCEYIDGGGAAYFETHDPNSPIHSPGDIVNNIQHRTENGTLIVSPDPDDDNYSLFAEICHESQENNWNEGEAIEGNAWLHSAYNENQFAEGVEEGTLEWYQVLANASNGQPGAIAYGYGRGAVLVLGHPTGHTWENWTQDGMWGSIAGEILFYLTEMAGPKWLMTDPEEGVIGPEDSFAVNLLFTPVDLEGGVYELRVVFEMEESLLEMSAVMSVETPVASITGTVIDEETNEPVEGVNIDLHNYALLRISDEEGSWEVGDMLPLEHTFTFTADDYLPETHVVDLGEDDIELNVSLRHSELALDPEEIAIELAPDDSQELNVTGTNAGNGPLTYTTDRRLLGDANAEPWEHRVGVPAGVIAEDSRIQGAVFVNDHFYASGANNREPLIHVFNRDQELVNQYAQLGESRYGYKDLASDGEIIWGSGERTVYGFNTDGEEVMSFDSGISPCNNLAWDPDREILWVSGTTTDIIGFDRDGNQVAEVGRHNYRVYGLAYWPDDPDGCQLYIFHKINEVGDLMIAKVDIENDRAMDVANLMHEDGGVAQGCFITNQYDIYSWVFLGVANSGAEDRIDIWQVDARKDWMGIEPTEGVIEAGEEQDFVVTLDATELPQALFEGEIVFLHDGVGGETHFPVSLQVGEGGGPEEMILNLNDGWNMISSYVQPDPDDVVEITADLVEAGSLIMMKNSIGQFYNPQFNFNNIPGWRVDEGYLIKMDGADELTLIGESVPWNEPIALGDGWQMISYYPRQGVDAVLALSGIVDVLIMAKDGQGRFYNPQFNFSNMGEMIPGQGYLLKMDEAAELVYTVDEEAAGISQPFRQPENLPIHANTGENMSLLVLSDLSEGEIGVYCDNNVLVGSGVIQDGMCGVSVWGDDPTTYRIDGALNGDDLEIKYWDGSRLIDPGIEKILGDIEYTTDDFNVVRLLDVVATPDNFGIVSAFPNPFNNHTRITYNLPEAQKVDLALFDLSGRRVLDIASGSHKAGHYSVTIEGSDLTSGIYIAQCKSGLKTSQRKIILVK